MMDALTRSSVAQTVLHWELTGVTAIEAWDALEGTPLVLRPTWPAVQALAMIRAREMAIIDEHCRELERA